MWCLRGTNRFAGGKNPMDKFTISEMQEMQMLLQEKYKDKWEPICAEIGQNKLLWMIGEIGEVIDIVKKQYYDNFYRTLSSAFKSCEGTYPLTNPVSTYQKSYCKSVCVGSIRSDSISSYSSTQSTLCIFSCLFFLF